MVKKNPPDERLVYLAFRNVAHPKKIWKLIQKHVDERDESDALLVEHSIDNICNAAKALLQDEIFETTLRAKMRFPEL